MIGSHLRTSPFLDALVAGTPVRRTESADFRGGRGPAVRALSLACTDLFVGSEREPLQLVRVEVTNCGSAPVTPADGATVWLRGGELDTPDRAVIDDLPVDASTTVEVGVRHRFEVERSRHPVEVVTQTHTSRQTAEAELVAAVPGWRVHMISHFHYDPVWWHTQAAYTESWSNTGVQQPGLALVAAHLEMARLDPDYKFVLAELDYLKPYWQSRPRDRAFIRRLIRDGRLELVGGTYNEPSPNLTGLELTIRNIVYGMGYQRGVLGGDPASAWMLDVFGHDPQFPGLCAEAGLTSSSWARGPHHEWGPKAHVGDNTRMQFPTEFDWMSPSGRSLLTSYMPNHYSAGWWMDAAPDLVSAEAAVYQVFQELKAVAATRNCLLPVGTDYTPPNRWITKIHRDWASRYVWPKFLCSTARDFFDAVRRDAAERRVVFSPQTRDMNPIFTGCQVSYIDTKQAQRRGENAVVAAEKFATVAALLGARYPNEALDKAWRQLVYGAHHDAITGSESDQVYVDLLASWREALDLAQGCLDTAHDWIAGHVDTAGEGTPVVVFNPTSSARTDLAQVPLHFDAPGPPGVTMTDPSGQPADVLVEDVVRHPGAGGGIAEATVSILARDVPGTGYAVYRAHAGGAGQQAGWRPVTGTAIENEFYRLAVDPDRGGVISDLYDKQAGKQMLKSGGLANELLAYDEYPNGPGAPAGGPWVTATKGGPTQSSAQCPAEITVYDSPLGQRIVVRGPFAGCIRVQEITLWRGIDRVDFSTTIEDFSGTDTLVRVRFQPEVVGGMPISETAGAVIGRGFGFPNEDYAWARWTLDYPAHNWFELGSTLTVRLTGGAERAVSVAELVGYDQDSQDASTRTALAALARRGVTATMTQHDGQRYGALDVDSNLPDIRIAVGGPEVNQFTAAVLAAAEPGYQGELDHQLSTTGRARVWVPAESPLDKTWQPWADLRGERALPVLIVAGIDAAATTIATYELAADLDRAPVIVVDQPPGLAGNTGAVEPYGFAVLNRGLPGYCIDVSGDLYLALLRSSTGWPSGVWTQGPRRTLPDGANFQTQHWSQRFEYSAVGHRGDWRAAGLVRRGQEYNNPLAARVVPAHTGPLPTRHSFLAVTPDTVVATAFKPRGNPLATQSGAEVDLAHGVTIRLAETSGRSAVARVDTAFELAEFQRVDLLEAAPEGPADGTVSSQVTTAGSTELAGFEVATFAAERVATGPAAPSPGAAIDPAESHDLAALNVEPVQPVYAQYWRHNSGGAPIGNLPMSIGFDPEVLGVGQPFTIDVSVNTELTAATATGSVRIVTPSGWTVSPDTWDIRLDPGAAATTTVTVDPEESVPGRYFLSAVLTHGRQQYESVATVDFGPVDFATVAAPDLVTKAKSLSIDRATRKARLVPAPPMPLWKPPTGDELAASVITSTVEVRPGENTQLLIELSNRANSQLRGAATLIAPFALWPAIPSATRGFAVEADATTQLAFDVSAPVNLRPGHWWALVKLAYFGRTLYLPAVPVHIGHDPQA